MSHGGQAEREITCGELNPLQLMDQLLHREYLTLGTVGSAKWEGESLNSAAPIDKISRLHQIYQYGRPKLPPRRLVFNTCSVHRYTSSAVISKVPYFSFILL